jgi:hypothetical protein
MKKVIVTPSYVPTDKACHFTIGKHYEASEHPDTPGHYYVTTDDNNRLLIRPTSCPWLHSSKWLFVGVES